MGGERIRTTGARRKKEGPKHITRGVRGEIK
jgi:hypothetical protein